MHCTSVRVFGTAAALLILASCSRHFHGAGVVVALNAPAGEVTISHRAIGKYMPPMSMPFHVSRPSELNSITPGARVRFDLRVGRKASVITKLRVDAGAPPDFPMPVPVKSLSIGDVIPDFNLTDEHGRSFGLADILGHTSAIEFIYTRCPLPDVCPRLSANFAVLQKRFGTRLTLLSVTIDPEHDTPEVLQEYAHRWGADNRMWHFLTGSPERVRGLAEPFGLVYFAEEGAITHTSSTALIGPTGRLAARLEGSSYTTQQLVDLVSQFLLRSGEGSHP